ncbi:MAG: glycosyltransferase [Cytophagaceae bacterium]|mgnify:CR=1 FL=1|nr:glycosyltransferase [Cytophagaceae bacterium]|tara:strand:- start:2955 stop:3641 length:687 start_codon:yes stop_codon:yes gene_type:complete
MGILSTKETDEKDEFTADFHFPSSDKLLIIFTRNPELGKCKTRLAATVGDEAALEIYTFLLKHTAAITNALHADKQVHYSEKIRAHDLWDETIYEKKLQQGDDLGERMHNAASSGFKNGFRRIIIIGSDMYDLDTRDIEQAFDKLQKHDFVLGPAQDGGYYLFGMKTLNSQVFKNKNWGTETVLEDTLKDLQGENVALLDTRNDVDYYEDIKDIAAFQKFIPKEFKTT